jgi:hypothetical protein
VTCVTIPLDTPPSGLAPHVGNALRELFVLFGGTEYGDEAIAHFIDEFLKERS